ncbi:MAG: hypothetical protein ACJAR6_000853 [Oleispira sp.]|jgi:hypothetical protein
MKILTASLIAGLGCMSLLSASIMASSHREAPNLTRFPTLDSSDFYAFNSYEPARGEFVTLIANYIPLQDAYGGPNYFAMDPAAVYSIHIDNDGDAIEDLTYQFRFTNKLANNNQGIALPIGPEGNQRTVAVPLKNIGGITAADQGNANFFESYEMTLVTGSQNNPSQTTSITNISGASFNKPLDYIGDKSFGDTASYAEYANSFIHEFNLPGCGMGKVFVGQRKDAFVVNLGKTFDLVNYAPIEGDSAPGANDGGGFPGGITQDSTNDDLLDKNVTSISIELPKSCVIGNGNGVIGAWTTASLPQARILNPQAAFGNTEVNGGALTQVSRLGSPLVNELVIGLKDKDTFSAAHPKDDGQFADYVTHPSLPALLDILFRDAVGSDDNIAPTNFPRTDLVSAFLTGFAGVNQLATVTPSEMLRLNTEIPATLQADQSTFGVAGGDNAGFPNGRRPGDDVVDIALRVVMGFLCHTPLDSCIPEDAPVGTAAFTDGAPISALDTMNVFPYLSTPLSGSVSN